MKTTTQENQKKRAKFGAKTNLKNIAILCFTAIILASCNQDKDNDLVATAAAFLNIREQALNRQTQNFTLTAGTGLISFTSAKGVILKIDGNSLTKNGNPVTGAVNIEFVELFDKGSMLVTNKPTMGVMTNGDHSLLISGGEFFIKATQGGAALATISPLLLQVPTNLTNGADQDMTLWNGIIKDDTNLVWQKADDGSGANGRNGLQVTATTYYLAIGNFGWTNVDKFFSDPRPRTTILAAAPVGYDNTNSAIYLSYDGEGQNALAQLDTYTTTGLFSEHYGQIPIGLACHVIFVTEDNGQWRYAIKAVTTQANDVYTFTLSETTLATEAQLIAAINAIQ
jgi:hypothetical protein